jgi:hypothetical protein
MEQSPRIGDALGRLAAYSRVLTEGEGVEEQSLGLSQAAYLHLDRNQLLGG